MPTPNPLIRPVRRAFTLVELLISLGIALLLIYGINLVFRAVTDTVRVGNALAVATRKMRSVDSAITLDFEGTPNELDPTGKIANGGVPQYNTDLRWSGIAPVVTDLDAPTTPYEKVPRQPAITIFCKRTYAFMSRADQDAGPDPTKPWLLDEEETGTTTDFTSADHLARLGTRAHRVDTIGFFTGGSYVPRAKRPKSEEASYIGQQAWVWYGHLLQHNSGSDFEIAKTGELKKLYPYDAAAPTGPKSGSFFQPGDGNANAGTAEYNPRNFYASDWVLGRVAITLLPRVNSDNKFPGTPFIGLPSGEPIQQVFAEATGKSPGVIDFDAEEKSVSFNSANVSAGSHFDKPPASVDEDAYPIDLGANAPVPFTSGLNDVAAVWPGISGTLLPTGDIGIRTPTNDADGNFVPANFHGLINRYLKLQSPGGEPATWWKRSMVQFASAATKAPYTPLRFNTVSAFSRPLQPAQNGVNLLTPQAKSALQATYLAKGCTQFIVEFAGDFCAQNPADGKKTSNGPDGILDYYISPTTKIRSTRWYGLPRDVDGDGFADVVRVGDFLAAQQSFEKIPIGDPDFNVSYVVAFGPLELYPAGKSVAASVRPWLIRLTVNLNDAASNLGTGLQREFVFKVR